MMLSVRILKFPSSGFSFCTRMNMDLRQASRNTFRGRKGLGPVRPASLSGFITQSSGLHTLVKPLIFTVCFSSSVFVCAAVWQYEEMRKKARLFRNQFNFFGNSNTYSKKGRIRQECGQWLNRFTEGQKVASVIIALNVCVFLMWRIPALQPFMQKYFASNPAMKRNCLPMILSTFSHHSFMHMAVNMYVLYSFSSSSVGFFGKEQFVALYLSSGVVSSFASYMYKVLTKSYSPSLGASGALMGILSSNCMQFPHAQLAFVFFPFFTIPAGMAIKGVMALDFFGLLAKWRVFDHAAHLGGAFFGIFYLYHGQRYIWEKREPVVTWWHNLRKRLD